MAINMTTLESTLQTKFNAVTDPKEMLLLGKAYESTVGGISVTDIEKAAATGVTNVETARTDAVNTVSSSVNVGVTKIKHLMNTKFNGGSGGSYRSSFVIDADDKLCGWGCDNANQQANGRGLANQPGMHALAFRIEGGVRPGKMIQVEKTGGYSGMGLDDNGVVWAWGYNGHGQWGSGHTENREHGQKVNFPGGTVITRIAAGKGYQNDQSNQMLALDSAGNCWTWGYNGHGQCGRNGTSSNASTYTPQIVLTGVEKIYACNGEGAGHSGAIKTNGDAYLWGYNGYGNIGSGNTSNQTVPMLINGRGSIPSGANVVHLALKGHNHNYTVVTTSDGKIHMCGYNGHGQLNNGNTSQSNNFQLHQWFNGSSADRRVKIDTDKNKGFYGEDIGAYVWINQNNSQSSSMALSESNKLYFWGNNEYGISGYGNATNTNSGAAYHTHTAAIKSVAMGGYDAHNWAAMLKEDGTLLMSGYNGNYQACQDSWRSDTYRYTWREPSFPYGIQGNIAEIVVSGTTSESVLVLKTTDGTLWVSGYGGEMAQGTDRETTMGHLHRIEQN